MKIIISHDVDYLFGSDHLKDLIYPRLRVRESLALLRGKISFSDWRGRLASCFKKERNYIDELMNFDEAHGVKACYSSAWQTVWACPIRPRELFLI